MFCEKCGKYKATTHIKSVVNGKITELHLCDHCATQFDVPTGGFSFDEMLSSFFGETSSQIDEKRCACCGSSFSDIAENGKVGCSECYLTFKDDLLPYIRRVHGSIEHIGKTLTQKPIKENSLETLKAELKELVSQEKYEEAAVLRDKIKAMEEKQ